MLKTERMKWVVVAGAKPHLVAVIRTLQDLKAVHLQEHTPDEFFSYGDPLPEGEQIAEARLKARGLAKNLGLDDTRTKRAAAPRDWDEAVQAVAGIEAEVNDLLKERDALRQRLKEEDQEEARLRRLAPLGLRLEEFGGYRNIQVLLGTVTADPTPRLAKELPRHEIRTVVQEPGFLIALFVLSDDNDRAERVLGDFSFHALDVPDGAGPIEEAIGRHAGEARRLRARLAKLEDTIEAARREHGGRLLAADAVLATAAERANAPLRFASSRHGFVVTGYVPTGRVDELRRVLDAATDHGLYMDIQEPRIAKGHGHEENPEAQRGAAAAAHPPRVQDPPIRFRHKRRSVASFTQMLRMHSFPKYREIDPTVLMWFTFPLFFAVMIGDLAFGILIMLVAAYLFRHSIFGIGGPRVSRMLMLAGLWTTLFGVFVYGEAFGIHFVEPAGHLSWEWIFGADWHNFYVGHGDTHHLGFSVGDYTLQLGYLSKLVDVIPLLAICVVIAILHLNLALFFGIYNQWILHGPKHAILARVSWLVMEVGIAGLAYGGYAQNPTIQWAGAAVLLVAIVMIIAGEGVIGALELPKLISNAASYFRLAAVAMSKAGMALAVNTFAFVMVTDTTASVAGVGGWVLLVIGHLIILALGIIAGGLHAMRLQLVEFFGWFFEGGGRPFQAFGDPGNRP